MAESPSWFSRSSSGKKNRSSRSNHELPRWHSPSPMAASMIPPPIVESAYLSPSRAPTKSIIVEKPPASESRESELQADLQFLLDAQADGLIKGLEGGMADDGASTGSTTPTAKSFRNSITRQANKPIPRKIGLRSARKGIYNSIVALATVKDEELQSVDADVAKREHQLGQIDTWEKKRQGLNEAASSVDASEETVRVQRLRQEADTLQEEINNVEMQLSDMKTRHRMLLRQAAAAENAVQAQLASYTSSLSLLESDIQKFLTLEPRDGRARPTSSEGQQSVWQLPAKRRTLEMAKERIGEEREAILQQRQSIELEREALDQGAKIWRDVAADMTDFEKKLRVETVSLGPSVSDSNAWDDTPQTTPTERLRGLLKHMDTVIEKIETNYTTVKERNWNLLIAAIGAELDALKRGKQILESVLGSTAENEDLVNTSENDGDGAAGSLADGEEEIHKLDRSFEAAQKRSSNGPSDTDDEPDPELLFTTRQDTSDTE